MRIKCRDETASGQLAGQLVEAIASGSVSVGLCGDLGAGKTTFIRYLVKALCSPDPVSSPSFVLQHEYRTKSGLIIEHWDLYRLNRLPDELLEPPSSKVLRLVEWADRFPEYLEILDLIIMIGFCDNQEQERSREFTFSGSLLTRSLCHRLLKT